MLLGNNKNMHGSLRLYVIECNNLIIFINLCCGNFSIYNFTENAIHINTSFI